MKASRHWTLCGKFTGHRWIPRTNGQSCGKSFHLMTSSCIVKSLKELLLTHCSLCPYENSKCKSSSSIKWVWKCCLQNVIHSVQASVCLLRLRWLAFTSRPNSAWEWTIGCHMLSMQGHKWLSAQWCHCIILCHCFPLTLIFIERCSVAAADDLARRI